jgi:uncharacterized membrane protein
MKSSKRSLLAAVFGACLTLCASAAHAGGPLFLNQDGKPLVYGPGPVPVYYDQGDFARITDWSTDPPGQVVLDNAVGRHVVEKGFGDWSNVPTSSFRATVVGDFSLLGLPDVDANNAAAVIGKWNGGGVYVIFDADGSIMENYFGVGPNVLGISTPEWAEDDGTVTESWTVLNGRAIDPHDDGAAQYQGIATHEFGHSIGLAHTQTNGAAYFYSPVGESPGPQSCGALPYATAVTAADVETMYPFANPTPGTGTGIGQANIHTTDDLSAISDLYPAAGWPDAYGTITGTVYSVDGKTPLMGVNVVARNVSDPFGDATSTMSGEWTQGLFGPDGKFTLHGLKPGAQYVLYVDAVLAGGFPTEPLWFLPGKEKFYSVAANASDRADRERNFETGSETPRNQRQGPGITQPQVRMASAPTDPCAYMTITVEAGQVFQADIQFDRIAGAPVLFNLGYGTGASSITADGSTVVGNYGRGGPVFKWTAKTGVEILDDSPSSGEQTFISPDGRYIASNLITPNNENLGTYRWDDESGWTPITPAGYCGVDSNYAWGVTNDGSVYGLAYRSCNEFRPFRWRSDTGTTLFPTSSTLQDGRPANGRMNQISADGSVMVGWEENDGGERHGVVWVNGVPSKIENEDGEWLGEASAVSHDGSMIAGSLFSDQEPLGSGWRRGAASGPLEYVSPVSADSTPLQPFTMSRDGKVMAGLSGDPFFSFSPAPFLWTKEMGAVSLDDFVQRQGTSIEQYFSLWTPMAMSDDGTVITGWAPGFLAYASWVLQIKSAFVCHASDGSDARTMSVAFPDTFDEHLSHGDTVGPCQDHPDA